MNLRCEICNYTMQDGSDLLDTAPNKANKLAHAYDRLLCKECRKSITEVLLDYEDKPTIEEYIDFGK